MDEDLGYNEDEMPRKTSTQWHFARSSAEVALEKDSSRLFLQYRNYHLHLVQKKEVTLQRPIIPTTMHERLSFFRNYVTSPIKTQIFCMQHTNVIRFFWNYVFNVFFKSVPHTFVHIFLASYAPEEHLFLAKMVPFFYGSKFACLLAAMMEILSYINMMILLICYTIHGLWYKSPWNRCPSRTIVYTHLENKSVTCCELKEFTEKISNSSWSFTPRHGFYVTANGELFQLVQMEYLRYFSIMTLTMTSMFMYFVIIWSATLLCQELVFKRRFWQVLNTVQWLVTVVEFISFMYLIWVCVHDENTSKTEFQTVMDVSHQIMWRADIDMLAESITAPPVLHVLTARSSQEIDPSRDSTFIIVSNALLYIFKGFLTNRMKHYCENLIGAPIKVGTFNQHSWFFMWPLFFSTFYLGDLYTLGYFLLNLVMEFLTIIVAYKTLVEVVISEWVWVRRWMIAVSISIIYVALYIAVDLRTHVMFNIYCKAIVTCVEVLILYGLYPVGRLVDDIIFHYGASPTKLRILSFRLVPIFYFIKIYILLESLLTVYWHMEVEEFSYVHAWTLCFIPYVIGMVYIIYKYVFKDKLGWNAMFRPVNDWGPREYNARQLRKKFDSRYYIRSQAPRNLSRYLMGKSESKTYQLEIQYDPNRRSTVATSMFRLENFTS